MRNEVHALGAAHLERKKDKQTLQDQALQALGFSTAKKPRTGAMRPPHVVDQPSASAFRMSRFACVAKRCKPMASLLPRSPAPLHL